MSPAALHQRQHKRRNAIAYDQTMFAEAEAFSLPQGLEAHPLLIIRDRLATPPSVSSPPLVHL